MKCTEFDAHIDEMLSGILHPEANQHMRQCERCTSHYRARAVVQNSLRKLASATVSGPSHATDRAVMESYRRLQQRRAAALQSVSASSAAQILSFPSRSKAPLWDSLTAGPRAWISQTRVSQNWIPQNWLSGAAAAAVVFAVLGSAVHLWNGIPTVNAPIVANAPIPAPSQTTAAATVPASSLSGRNAAAAVENLRHSLQRNLQHNFQSSAQFLARKSKSNDSQPGFSLPQVASAGFVSTPSREPVLRATSARSTEAYNEASNYDSGPVVTQLPANAAPVIHLATSGSSGSSAAGNVAQSASSTWPGYSNLMYCDPVVCSGPMQVVHIKVPVGQVKPNLGQTVGNTFVNAEVVIGPDGVARAIRVAN